MAVGGAAIGFLRYNFPPAKIFLGDAGSMLLGFLMAALTLKLDLPVGEAAPRALSTFLLVRFPSSTSRWSPSLVCWTGGH